MSETAGFDVPPARRLWLYTFRPASLIAATSSGQISSWRRLYSASVPGRISNVKQMRSIQASFRGFVFDALVLTLSGAAWDVRRVRVERVVNLSGFSAAVLRRIGVGHTPAQFEAGARSGAITGHIGFPQSMRVVAGALGRSLERIERELRPLVAERPFRAESLEVPAGRTAGFEQRYRGSAGGEEWFHARLVGHLDPPAIGEPLRDELWLEGEPPLHLKLDPGLNAQATVAAVVVNSLRRVVAAPPGWLTVADLPPAVAR